MNRTALKANAKAQIKGKIGILFLITLIIGLISGAAGLILAFIPGGSILASVVITPAFTLSTVRVYLMLLGNKTPTVTDAFSGFDDFWSAFKVNFFVGLFTFLWSLLFIIPGIVKSFFLLNVDLYFGGEQGKEGAGVHQGVQRNDEWT